MNTNDVLNKLIAEIERLYDIAREASYNGEIEGEMTAYDKILDIIASLQQEQPDTCIFGNTPSESSCRFCGVDCELREPKQSGTTSTNLSSTNEAVGLAIMAYLDTKVKHDNAKVCGVSLKVAREWIREKIAKANKQEQPEVELDEEITRFWKKEKESGQYIDTSFDTFVTLQRIAYHFANWQKEQDNKVKI